MGLFWRRTIRAPVNPFDLSRPLFRVSDADIVTLGQACEGVLICGATGAGKTSGPGDLIARALLNAGAGFLVLCAKTDECERWERLCREAGRAADFVRFGPGGPAKLDVLQYALSMPGGSIDAVAQLLDQLADLSSRSSGSGGDDKFWQLLAAKIARRCIAIARLGAGAPTLAEVRRVLASLPHTPEEAVSREWALNSFAGRCLAAAVDHKLTGADARLLEQCGAFVEEWAALSDKTRSIGYTMVDNVLDRFLFGEMAGLVAAGETTLSPEDVLAGKVVVLDVPVLRYREPARFTQLAWKLLVQRRVLQRDVRANPRPVVIWSDEAQFFVCPSADCMAQSVARQARMVTVMMTQSVPLLVQELGGTPKAEQEVTALLTNLQTKVLCQNTCPVTNEAFSKLLGEHRDVLYSGSSQMGNEFDFVGDLMGATPAASCSYSEQYRPQYPPWKFGLLSKGGPPGFAVEAVVFQGGRVWSNGRTWLVSTFEQPRR